MIDLKKSSKVIFYFLILLIVFGIGWITLGEQPNGTRSENNKDRTNFAFEIEPKTSDTPGLWNGSSSTDWFTTSNWDDNSIPNSTVNVIIPSGCNFYPNVTASSDCHDLTIQSGGSLSVSTGSIDINDDLLIYGSLIMNNENGAIDVGDDVYWYDGSSASITDGSIYCGGDWRFFDGCSVILGNDCIVRLDGTSTQYIYNYESTSCFGDLSLQNNGLCYFDSSSTYNLAIGRNLIISLGAMFDFEGTSGTDCQMEIGHDFWIYGSLIMDDADDQIDVERCVYWEAGSSATITAGSIYCGGNWQWYAGASIVLGDDSMVYLDGSSTQYVNNFENTAASSFGDLTIQTNGLCYYGDSSNTYLTIGGDLIIESGATFDFEGASGTDCQMEIGHDFWIYGSLIMDDADDQIDVERCVYWEAGSSATITAGSIYCGGNWQWYAGASIVLGDDSMVYLDGSSTQYVNNFENTAASSFGDLTIQTNGLCYYGDSSNTYLTIGGDLIIESGATFDFEGTSGTDCSMQVGGDLNVYGTLIMDNADDQIEVNGSISWESSSTASITEGKINCGGNWNFSDSTFLGSHINAVINISGDFIIDEGNFSTRGFAITVNGSVVINQEGNLTIAPNTNFFCNSVYISGILKLLANGTKNSILNLSCAINPQFKVTSTGYLYLLGFDEEHRAIICGDSDSRINWSINGSFKGLYYMITYPTQWGVRFTNSAIILLMDNGIFDNPPSNGVLLNLTDVLNVPDIIWNCVFNNSGITPEGSPPYNVYATSLTKTIIFMNATGDLAKNSTAAEDFDSDVINKIIWGNSPLNHVGALPPDFSYLFGSTGNNIEWKFMDDTVLNPKYTIYRNSFPILGFNETSWSPGAPIIIDIDGLAIGHYNFTIIIEDGLGGYVQDEVLVEVEDAESDEKEDKNEGDEISDSSLYWVLLGLSIILGSILIGTLYFYLKKKDPRHK